MTESPSLSRPAGRRPAWIPVVAMLLVLPVLLWLGAWQLHRASQKNDMLERFGREEEVVEIAAVLDAGPDEVRYRRVRATGQYLAERQFLLEGMTLEGRPGLHVLTPFELRDGRLVLVNRGWIPEPVTRDILPELPVAGAPRTLTGRVVHYMEPGIRLAGEVSEGWPRRVLYPTPDDIAAQLGRDVAEHMVWLDAAEPDGFRREWKPVEFGPARHIGYAVQWFGLAVTLVLIYLVMTFRRRRAG